MNTANGKNTEQSEKANPECTILDIFWERIFLHFVVKNPTGRDIYLRSNGKPLILLQQTPFSNQELEELSVSRDISVCFTKNINDIYHIELNMAAANDRSFLCNAKWEIGYYDSEYPPEGQLAYKHFIEEGVDEVLYGKRLKLRRKQQKKAGRSDSLRKVDLFSFCTIDSDLVHRLDGLGKLFRYDGTKYAYTVDFTTYSDNGFDLNVNLNSFFMRTNSKWEKRLLVFGSKRPKDITKRYIFALKTTVFQAIHNLVHAVIPHDGTHVLLLSETGTSLGANLECLQRRLRERQLDQDFTIEVSAREQIGNNHSYSSWLSVLAKIAKADYIFVDNYVPLLSRLKLNPNTKLIQLWHAGVGFKSVGFARFGKKASPYASGSCHQQYDWALAPSKSLVKTYEEVFGIGRERFLPVGMPRLDGFLNQKRIDTFRSSFYKRYPQLEDKKIILFAPTYRGSGQAKAYYEYGRLNLQDIFDFCGDEYVFIFKMHPFIKDTREFYKQDHSSLDVEIRNSRVKPNMNQYCPRIMDLTGKEDTNDLFYIADLLITDYSSVLYEFSAMKKPILFYTYDREVYESIRGVHQSIKDTAPGKVCDSFNELMSALKNQDYDYAKTLQFSRDNFDHDLNGATDRLIDSILLGSHG